MPQTRLERMLLEHRKRTGTSKPGDAAMLVKTEISERGAATRRSEQWRLGVRL